MLSVLRTGTTQCMRLVRRALAMLYAVLLASNKFSRSELQGSVITCGQGVPLCKPLQLCRNCGGWSELG